MSACQKSPGSALAGCKSTLQLIISEDLHSIKEVGNEIVFEQKKAKLFISY